MYVVVIKMKISILFLLSLTLFSSGEEQPYDKYSVEVNKFETWISEQVKMALNKYVECDKDCGCHADVIRRDLEPFAKTGITKEMFREAASRATKYQIIADKLFREDKCAFPSRCSGVEHYIGELATSLPNMEIAINVKDWPQVNMKWGHSPIPVFSFSKTADNYDIMYPAWSFWEGGPAIKMYPTGIGRWDQHRESIPKAAEKWLWESKKPKAFFRGSRTSNERDPLVLLSRSKPHLVDAQYTKNQAWKSDADTLHAPAASEVSFEEHCRYKYLFNYRGVAASFRLKHLFLCKSLVFHVGDEWQEFFYPSLKPWVHYVPVKPYASERDIEKLIEFFIEHDKLAKEIADRGFNHIWKHLREEDVKCYWKSLLEKYSQLVRYEVVKDANVTEVKLKHKS